jgi:hypothetical protein
MEWRQISHLTSVLGEQKLSHVLSFLCGGDGFLLRMHHSCWPWPRSPFQTTHSQWTFRPSWLIILVVALKWKWHRKWHTCSHETKAKCQEYHNLKKYLTASGASFRAAATYICGNLELSDRDKNEKSSICFLELKNWFLSVDFLLFWTLNWTELLGSHCSELLCEVFHTHCATLNSVEIWIQTAKKLISWLK